MSLIEAPKPSRARRHRAHRIGRSGLATPGFSDMKLAFFLGSFSLLRMRGTFDPSLRVGEGRGGFSFFKGLFFCCACVSVRARAALVCLCPRREREREAEQA